MSSRTVFAPSVLFFNCVVAAQVLETEVCGHVLPAKRREYLYIQPVVDGHLGLITYSSETSASMWALGNFFMGSKLLVAVYVS